jgi:hypothetical protein
MKDTRDDYENVVEQLIRDPKSYDSWVSDNDELEDALEDYKDRFWGKE